MAAQLGNLVMVTPAQNQKQAPYLQLNDSSSMAIERMLHKLPLTAEVAQNLGYDVPTGLNSNVRIFAGPLMESSALPDKKRPLNSWMAFRTYYAKIFSQLQQKVTSTYLTILWRRDPFKAKWTIVAKAYSSIRDLVGKDNAPLDIFLAIVVPEIGLIEVDDYLATLAWVIDFDAQGFALLKQWMDPELDAFPDHIAYTDMTERDVIVLCGDEGYINALQVAKLIGGASTIPTAQPTQASQQGLLASAPVLPEATENASPAELFMHQVMTDPAAAASRVLGFDVNQMLGLTDEQASKPYEWTGNMADIYTPSVGCVDLSQFDDESESGWDTTEVSDAFAFDTTLANKGAVINGYMVPSAPEKY